METESRNQKPHQNWGINIDPSLMTVLQHPMLGFMLSPKTTTRIRKDSYEKNKRKNILVKVHKLMNTTDKIKLTNLNYNQSMMNEGSNAFCFYRNIY